MKIGVYVGSFNPVHKGHIKIVNHLIEKKYVDKVIVIPTNNYWDKNNLINIKDRINMLKFYEDKNIEINTDFNDLPYTYLVLNEISKKYKKDEIYLIIGSDNLDKFHLWKNVETLYKYKILVIPRGKVIFNNNIKKENFIIVKDFKSVNFSSTIIREKINKNKLEELTKYVDNSVLNYILNNNVNFK